MGPSSFCAATIRGHVLRGAHRVEAATTTHYGEYTELAGAYAALERWCTEHQRQPSGVSWEVYGDWAEYPAERRTDVYFQLRPESG
ncbi:MAG: hypothetical protein ACRDNF_08405 [Streptosporangiaceae bacterium]